MTNTMNMESTLCLGVGKQTTKQNELALLYGCPTSAGAVILSMFYVQGTVEKSHRVHMLTQ